MSFAARSLGYLGDGLSATLPSSLTYTDTTNQGSGIAASAITYVNYLQGTGDVAGIWSVRLNAGASTPVQGTWLNSGVRANYDVRFDLLTGALGATSSAAGTWLSLSSNYNWCATKNSVSLGTNAMTGTLSIRNASTLVVLTTCAVAMTADCV